MTLVLIVVSAIRAVISESNHEHHAGHVTERTREIGSAWRGRGAARHILEQFLLEAVLIQP